MKAPALKRFGPLYNSIGLGTNPELVSARLVATQAAYKSLGKSHIVSLTRAACSLSKPDELEFLAAKIGDGDPTFDPKGGDAETAAVASAILWEMIESGGALRAPAALAVVSAGFGGIRTFVDPELSAFAASILTTLQRGARVKPANATYRTKPDLKDELDELAARATENNFSGGGPHLKNLIEASVDYSVAGLLNLAQQLQKVIDHQASLEEEMNIHWWLVGGWSQTASTAFSDLKPDRAAFLAGKELADLTGTNAGVASAPALLSIILDKGRRGSPKAASLASIVKATPISDRREWTEGLAENVALGSLTPLSFAASLAVDSDDAEDWKPRFQRLSGLDPEAGILPLDAALQVYRELLVIRELA